ncbi:hypothetical protein V8E51_019745 [Hyaloscypha variabilis]
MSDFSFSMGRRRGRRRSRRRSSKIDPDCRFENTPKDHARHFKARIHARRHERRGNGPHHYLYGWISDANYDRAKDKNDEISWKRRPRRREKWIQSWDKCATGYLKRRKVEEILEEVVEGKCRQEREQWRLSNATYRRPPHLNPTEVLPRGMQILAEDPYDLKKGFPYHPILESCDISIADWSRVIQSILGKFECCGGPRFHFPHAYDFEIHTLAKNIEYILDDVAEQDVSFFRPRGFIMRMDMPGEQEFGLDFMDLYVGRNGGRYNEPPYPLPHNLKPITELAPWVHGRERCEPGESLVLCVICDIPLRERKEKLYVDHRKDIRQKVFNGTRIVLDPLTVLEDPEMAYKHGWTNWIQQCANAKQKPSTSKDEHPPVLNDSEHEWDYFKALDMYYDAIRTRPLSERVFRWPPSKQIFYDRWRGYTSDAAARTGRTLAHRRWWVPWADSMDKRMHAQKQPQTVLPTDGIEVMELLRAKRGSKSARMDKYSQRSAKALPILQSELKSAYLRVHKAKCEKRFEVSRPNPLHYHHLPHAFWPSLIPDPERMWSNMKIASSYR